MPTRIYALTGLHLAAGGLCALAVLSNSARVWPVPLVLGFLALIGSQMLLLGMWAGLSNASWSTRVFGTMLGTGYLLSIGMAASPIRTSRETLIVGSLLIVPTTVVATFFLIVKPLFARVILLDHGIREHVSDRFQFSIKQLLLLTLGLSLVLAFGKTLQSRGGMALVMALGIGVFALVIALCSAMLMLLLVWSALGRHRVVIRLSLVICGAAIIGCVPPYYFGGPWWRFVSWSTLATVVAIICGSSLLVVRSCGYRLVRLRDIEGIELNGSESQSSMEGDAT